MSHAGSAVTQAIALFVGMMVCLEVGYRLGRRSLETHGASAHEGTGTIDAAVFALLGLLLAFTFAGSTSRLDAKRQLIVQEANAIGTAYLRLDVLPAGEQPEMRRLFREYIDARLRVYERLPDRGATSQELARAAQIQGQVWARAVAATGTDSSAHSARLVLLPALNEMIDVTTARTIALDTHLPSLIFLLLVCVALLSALLAGHAMAKRKARSLLHMVLYAVVIAATVYTVLDLEYPRVGLIRLDAADQALYELRDSIR
ncbi:MAG: hypothetical protein ACRD2Y_12565 [Terriglobales bacterium]